MAEGGEGRNRTDARRVLGRMKRANLLAAGVIAAAFVGLAVAPLTRDALRFDTRGAAGERPFAHLLADLGLRPSDLPGFGPPPPAVAPEPKASPSADFPVRLASATRLPGREKWAALQQLARDFPDQPAAHAMLCRFACKNGGAVGVGREDEIQAALPSPNYRAVRPQPNPNLVGDATILLQAAADGERLEPDNAFFPAMATIGFYALGRDTEARAALSRAVRLPAWREHLDTEAYGAVERVRLLRGPQPTSSETATLSGLLFPHYAQLRGMARLAAAHAIQAEGKEDHTSAIALRTDLWRLGAKMRTQSSTVIGSLVGIAIERLGASWSSDYHGPESADARRRQADAAFVAYLKRHDRTDLADAWVREATAMRDAREMVRGNLDHSAYGLPTLLGTQSRLFASLVLFGVISLLLSLAALAYGGPSLGPRLGRWTGALLTSVALALFGWTVWNAWGNAREMLALVGLFQGLAGDAASDTAAVQVQDVLLAEAPVVALAAGTLLAFAIAAPVVGRRRGIGAAAMARRWALPLAGLLTVVYAAHLIAFSRREVTVRAEYRQMLAHEGRYLAAKIGKTWPE